MNTSGFPKRVKHVFPIRITVIGGFVVIFVGLFVGFLWTRSLTLKDEPTLSKLVPILEGRSERYRTWRAYEWSYGHSRFLRRKIAQPVPDEEMLQFRIQAAQHLGDMGPGASNAVRSLTKIIQNREENPHLRLACFYTLEYIGLSARDELPILRNILSDFQSPSGRFENKSANQMGFSKIEYRILEKAVIAIARIGSSDQRTVNLIRNVSGITNFNIDVSAAVALWRLQPISEGFLSVSNYLMTGPPTARCQSVYVLTQMGAAAKPFKTILATMANDQEESVRKAVALALGQIQ